MAVPFQMIRTKVSAVALRHTSSGLESSGVECEPHDCSRDWLQCSPTRTIPMLISIPPVGELECQPTGVRSKGRLHRRAARSSMVERQRHGGECTLLTPDGLASHLQGRGRPDLIRKKTWNFASYRLQMDTLVIRSRSISTTSRTAVVPRH